MNPDPFDEQEPSGIPIPDALLAGIEGAINALLALDPEGAARLGAVQGQVLRIELAGFGTRIDIVPGDGELRLFGDYATSPDCTVRGTPAALLAMTLADHQEDQVFHGAVTIDGDNRVAQAIGDALRGLDIDWEEQLARVVGDGVAHRLGRQARAAASWGERSGETLREDLRDYLIEEGRLVPGPSEVRAFVDGVDALRDDVARCEARLERLVRLRAGDPSAQPVRKATPDPAPHPTSPSTPGAERS